MKFALDQPNNANNNNNQSKSNGTNSNSLQRSKSLSSADALARGIAVLGLGAANESNDIGTFKPEMQAVIEQALSDPNKLNARSLMVLANQIMQRAVEGRRLVEFISCILLGGRSLSIIQTRFQIRSVNITLLYFDHCERAKGNIFRGNSQQLSAMV